MWNLLPLDIIEADTPTSSMNDQTTFQSTSGTIKPNGLVQPSAQECSQTPVAASKARRSFLRHSPQSSLLPWSSTAGDPWLGWRPHTYLTEHSFVNQHTEQLPPKWTAGPHPATLNIHTQHSAKEATQAPQHSLINLPRAGAMLIILLPSQDNRHDTNETPLFRDTVKSSNTLPLFNYKSGLAYSLVQGKIKRCIKYSPVVWQASYSPTISCFPSCSLTPSMNSR